MMAMRQEALHREHLVNDVIHVSGIGIIAADLWHMLDRDAAGCSLIVIEVRLDPGFMNTNVGQRLVE